MFINLLYNFQNETFFISFFSNSSHSYSFYEPAYCRHDVAPSPFLIVAMITVKCCSLTKDCFVLWQYIGISIRDISSNSIIEYINGVLRNKLFIFYNVTCVYLYASYKQVQVPPSPKFTISSFLFILYDRLMRSIR